MPPTKTESTCEKETSTIETGLLSLPITSGTFKGIGGSYDLAGQCITIQLSLQWVPQANQIHFSINSNLQAIEADLDVKPTVTDNVKNAFAAGNVTLAPKATVTLITKGVCWRIEDPVSKLAFYVYVTNAGGAPLLIEVYQYVTNSLVIKPPTAISPVTVIYAGNITDPVDGPIFKELVTSNIDQNLKAFEFVFATVDVVTQLAKDDVWSWLQLTSNGYAVVEPLNSPSNDNCVFAIMSMVANRVNPNPVLQVDSNAIAKTAPVACSSRLACFSSPCSHQVSRRSSKEVTRPMVRFHSRRKEPVHHQQKLSSLP